MGLSLVVTSSGQFDETFERRTIVLDLAYHREPRRLRHNPVIAKEDIKLERSAGAKRELTQSGKRIRRAEERRTEIPYRRAQIRVIENIGHEQAEG